jgi:hypothetical protein
MRKIYFTLLIVPTLFSCSNDQSLCNCLEAGEDVNQLSASFFTRDYSVLGKDSLDALIHYRDSLCEEFKMMSGEDMLKLKENCD